MQAKLWELQEKICKCRTEYLEGDESVTLDELEEWDSDIDALLEPPATPEPMSVVLKRWAEERVTRQRDYSDIMHAIVLCEEIEREAQGDG